MLTRDELRRCEARLGAKFELDPRLGGAGPSLAESEAEAAAAKADAPAEKAPEPEAEVIDLTAAEVKALAELASPSSVSAEKQRLEEMKAQLEELEQLEAAADSEAEGGADEPGDAPEADARLSLIHI